MNAAKLWMVNEHLGRRNFTDDQKRYWVGKHLEMQKQQHGGQVRGSGQNGHSKTRQSVAKQHHVGERTVERNAKFARAVDTIAAKVGEDAKDAILRGARCTWQRCRSRST
jgi:hypothetical protein